MNTSSLFHPAVAAWFDQAFPGPTKPQAEAWPAIRAGKPVLIAAPTGSGKTLAAFLAAIDGLVRLGVAGELKDETHVVYVSPLKALSNDIKRNLEAPLNGIREALRAQGLPDFEIRSWVRTGDTPQHERERMRRQPPHIIVTTPESLYILLGSKSGRAMLSTTRSVIVDEIHALAPNKRGSHLALSLERLSALCNRPLLRIGLSATQKPIEDVARFLVGAGAEDAAPDCFIVDSGHVRERDLALELPPSPLEAVMSKEVWEQVYDRLAQLIGEHRTTLVFVNTRRLVERVTAQLAQRLGEEAVAAHHGSLSKEQRFNAEQRLKQGKLKVVVATASLELGIDIGDVNLVCQIGSPRSIAAFLQRVGRSGHAVTGTPKGRLFPLSRDELVESTALIDSVRRSELDRLAIPPHALDVLAQQIVAEVGARECGEEELFALARRAWPYRDLTREDFLAVLRMLGDGFSTRRGRRGALIHYDSIGKALRPRKGTMLTAVTSGGAIPDNADYSVLLEPENIFVGTVNEDFAVESMSGDVFQLGNHSYRILRVERGAVRVEDAHGMAPTIPFWLGEAPGRSDELSFSVSRLRTEILQLLTKEPRGEEVARWLQETLGLGEAAADELSQYLAAAHAALGCLPTQDTIVFERFFDEAGGMQLVIHSPFGSRINRAWGLALRKRFCRKFNFELQAAATEDNIVLSLTTAHSFDLADVANYLHPNSVRQVLIQAMLDAPMFTTRWRWVAATALALPRFQGGKKVPPQLARMNAEDLLGSVFPDQIACAENLVGEREIPDHPLVNQTISDCLREAMDIEGLERLLSRIQAGDIKIITRELTEPSPLALEVLSARPYAYLDDAPLEERRTQAVMGRRWISPEEASDLGKLDAEAISRVKGEAWPEPSNADELHDELSWLGFLTDEERARNHGWQEWLDQLAKQRRVARLGLGKGGLLFAAERAGLFKAIWPNAEITPEIDLPAGQAERQWTREEALVELVRGRLEGLGPIAESALAAPLGLEQSEISAALLALQGEGFAMRGRFTPGAPSDEWCERRLLARIHSYTIKRLRAEIEPVAAKDFMRFLFGWQRVAMDVRMEGPKSLDIILHQLEGYEAPAGSWESEILTARLKNYRPHWLDERCLSGQVTWSRVKPPGARPTNGEGRVSPIRSTPIALLSRSHAARWKSLTEQASLAEASPRAQTVAACIKEQGALFFNELVEHTGLLKTQVEEALAELVALGLVNSDSFGGLRALISSSNERSTANAGRWALVRSVAASKSEQDRAETAEYVVRSLLRRYGVVFWHLLAREAEWLPPWRDLLRVLRKLESRGEIRGGRFVAGFSGEQFALPDAIGMLREVRRAPESGEWISISGADPLNLAGVLSPGAKVAALTANRILYRNGLPIATLVGGETIFREQLSPAEEWDARKALLRSASANGAPHGLRSRRPWNFPNGAGLRN